MDQHSPSTARTAFTRREFGHHLRRLGATKSEASHATALVAIRMQWALLPLWRRAKILWRLRHG